MIDRGVIIFSENKESFGIILPLGVYFNTAGKKVKKNSQMYRQIYEQVNPFLQCLKCSKVYNSKEIDPYTYMVQNKLYALFPCDCGGLCV